jgi:hypothetical protein
MARETRNWRELCWAIINEQDSEKFTELVHRLLVALEERKFEKPYSASDNTMPPPKQDRSCGS